MEAEQNLQLIFKSQNMLQKVEKKQLVDKHKA